MARGKPCSRLSIKLLAMLLLAAMAAAALGLTLQVLGDYLVETVYGSEKRQVQRLQETIDSFRTYVREEEVASTNVEKIGGWNWEHPFIQLTVSANGAILNSSQWGAELVDSDSGLIFRAGNTTEDNAYPVNFTDGSYLVQVQDFSQNRLYNLVNWSSLIAGALVFLLLMLLYNSRVTSTISRLARQVRQVSKGDLTLEIRPSSRDEIGDLAGDVDAMRLSILDKLQREETAWRANAELITAISHDVRTPLTTLIGYLDILGESEYLTPTQQQEYLGVCRQKAEKLRELTNELFSYFLVFGRPEPELHLESLDAETLLEQMLGEQTADLIGRGYQVQAQELPAGRSIRVDVQHLRRIFDNLFSNILKYADRGRPVTVSVFWQGDELHVSICNYVSAAADRVESTKIGLRTCEKLLTSMGGRFLRRQDAGRFTVELVLPADVSVLLAEGEAHG